MTRQTCQSILLAILLTTSWVASAWTTSTELADIADEITALATDVPQHSFPERAILGKEVNVTLPQLTDRLIEVEVRLRRDDNTAAQTLHDLAAIRWNLKGLETRVSGIELARDEPTYLVMRDEMQQGLEDLGRRMDALNTFAGEQEEIFAH